MNTCADANIFAWIKPLDVSRPSQSLSVQQRLFKSLKLWSFYVDLEESIGTVETTKAVYDRILELRIANAQVSQSSSWPNLDSSLACLLLPFCSMIVCLFAL